MNTSETPADRGQRRSLALWLVKLGISILMLVFLFRQQDINVQDVLARIRSASVGWVLVALLLYLAMVIISTWRWHLLLRVQQIHVRFWALFRSFLIAIFANNFLPSNIGGDVLRIRDTAPAAQSKTLATAVVLFDRWFGLLGLVTVAAAGSLAAELTGVIGRVGLILLWTGLAGALVASFVLLRFPGVIAGVARPLQRIHVEWVGKRIAQLTAVVQRLRGRPEALITAFLNAILVQTSLVFFYLAVAAALHLTIPVVHLAVLIPLSFLVQMFPLSVNGHGIREWTFTAYLSQVGVSSDSAVALSGFAAVLVILFSMSGAAAYLSRRNLPAPATAD
jgi:uncharacterized protein (TIRG00374 family)